MFAVLTGLMMQSYRGLEDNYDINKGAVLTLDVTGLNNESTSSTGNIMEQFERMQLMKGIDEVYNGFFEVVQLSSFFDLVGGLLMATIGTLRTILGVIFLPFELVKIILSYYVGEIPGVLGGLAAMIAVYAGFIFLSIKVGRDL